ncbi:MAG: SDR family oxidoreductase [Candidatus Korarchaeota archaeon]|nr:SDR family oxidoreductase [Candidatus Korarchaeota archaeon]
MLLEDKVALITGGTSGIGLATAHLFASEGASVAIVGRSQERGAKALKYLSSRGYEATYHRGDVSKEEDSIRVVKEVVEIYGGIDILVNAAGVFTGGPITDLSVEDWDRTINVNLRGTFLMSKFVVPYMLRKGGGSIINVSSTAGVSPYPNGTAYCSAKAAVIAFTRALALELASKGIRVNVVVPGLTDTPMLRSIAGSEEAFARFPQLVPIGKIAVPEQVAKAILFLASEDLSSYITGALLVVDGGMTAGRVTTAGSQASTR